LVLIYLHRPVHTDGTTWPYIFSWNTAENTIQGTSIVGESMGGNYVDCALKVVVMKASGTVMVSYNIKNL
jgi:hypothetical protein